MRLNNWSIAASYDTARIFAGLGFGLLHREQVDHLAPAPQQLAKADMRASRRMRAIDPTETLAMHCGKGFEAGFSPYQTTRLRR
jgi:hypothetical protein